VADFQKSTATELQRAKMAGAMGATAPRVITAEFDQARDRLVLEFDQGFAVAVSLRGFPGFQHATALDLSAIEILGSGDALHFGRIDQSLNVSNLLEEMTGLSTASPDRRAEARRQPPIRVQGGYVVQPSGEPPPSPPKGGSSLRPPKP
jgi:hypothetical protein